MANDAEVQPAPRQDNSARGSFGRLKSWAGEKPWHMWLLVLIGLATLYLMYRIWKGQQSNTSGGFFAGLGGQPNSGPPPTAPPPAAPPPGPQHWWDTLLHSLGNPTDTDIADPANYNNEGYYTIGAAQGAGNTMAQLAAFFHLKGGFWDIKLNPHNKGRVPKGPNDVIASGTEIWITRSTIQS